jgi:serine phosphatase RsbU (regulator of sigma subunit)/pSer/pThr/pTyr-binding forkhead associated (FHA) protein
LATSSLIILVPNEVPFEVALGRDEINVGRAEANVLPLRDMNVSRHHFQIQRRGEHWLLSDLKSRNGTLVNGVAVLTKVLAEGDRIQVGNSQLTFRSTATARAIPLEQAPRTVGAPQPTQPASQQGAPPASPPGSGPMKTQPPPQAQGQTQPASPGAPPSGPQTRRPLRAPPVRPPPVAPPTLPFSRSRVAGGPPNLGGMFGLSPAPQPGSVPPKTKGDTRKAERPKGSSRLSLSKEELEAGQSEAGQGEGETPPVQDERWRKLAEVACAINMVHDLEQLLEETLDAVLALVPAKSAFLVLIEDGELVVRANRNAPDVDFTSEGHRLSRQVCHEAIQQKRPVLTQDATSDDQLGQYLSVVNLKLRSILCVPFSFQEEVLGVVYLDEPGGDPFADQGAEVELVGAFGDLAGIALANARMLIETRERERMAQELAIASRIQEGLLPTMPPTPTGLELAGRTVAARGVGGDIYDYFTRDEPTSDVLISIGDVAGKGVGAGLVMASVRALLHAYGEVYERTDDLLRHLNAVLSRDLQPGIFVSFLLIRYDPATGRMHYTGAGHEHLVVYRPSTGETEMVRAGGVVLGLVEDLGERIKEETLTLLPGDVVCLYTDGATEAPDAEGEEFGLERLAEAVREGPLDPAAIVERVMNAVQAFENAPESHDDLTVVALRKT